jgi:hypothetical protein
METLVLAAARAAKSACVHNRTPIRSGSFRAASSGIDYCVLQRMRRPGKRLALPKGKRIIEKFNEGLELWT